MTEDAQRYLDEVQARICHKCIDGDGKGNCMISHKEDCALVKFFPQVLESVRATYSSSMEPYESALRKHVCAVCTQSSDGLCAVRNDVECSLDRYFPMIVRVIEELDYGKKPTVSETGWKHERTA